MSINNKDILIQYKGGGYDGCMWEWNLAVIVDGVFESIFHSGYAGCTTLKEWKAFKDSGETYYIYDLHDPDSLQEFCTSSTADSVLLVAQYLEDLFIGSRTGNIPSDALHDVYLKVPCKYCKGQFDPLEEAIPIDTTWDSWRGWNRNFSCSCCLSSHRCKNCGADFDDTGDLYLIEDDYYCEFCVPSVVLLPVLPKIPSVLSVKLQEGNSDQIRALKQLNLDIDEYIRSVRVCESMLKDKFDSTDYLPDNPNNWSKFLAQAEEYKDERRG